MHSPSPRTTSHSGSRSDPGRFSARSPAIARARPWSPPTSAAPGPECCARSLPPSRAARIFVPQRCSRTASCALMISTLRRGFSPTRARARRSRRSPMPSRRRRRALLRTPRPETSRVSPRWMSCAGSSRRARSCRSSRFAASSDCCATCTSTPLPSPRSPPMLRARSGVRRRPIRQNSASRQLPSWRRRSATEHPRLDALIDCELVAAPAGAFVEAHYDAVGTRRVSLLGPLDIAAAPAEVALNASDVVLVTGGAKGITAECALALAQHTGARLALIGRDPETSPAIAAALDSFAAAGAHAVYVAADVTDAAATAAAVRRAEQALGSISAVIHGAGINEPRLLGGLDLAAVQATLAPKLAGLANVIAALDQPRPALVVALGSTIGRRGVRGAGGHAGADE